MSVQELRGTLSLLPVELLQQLVDAASRKRSVGKANSGRAVKIEPNTPPENALVVLVLSLGMDEVWSCLSPVALENILAFVKATQPKGEKAKLSKAQERLRALQVLKSNDMMHRYLQQGSVDVLRRMGEGLVIDQCGTMEQGTLAMMIGEEIILRGTDAVLNCASVEWLRSACVVMNVKSSGKRPKLARRILSAMFGLESKRREEGDGAHATRVPSGDVGEGEDSKDGVDKGNSMDIEWAGDDDGMDVEAPAVNGATDSELEATNGTPMAEDTIESVAATSKKRRIKGDGERKPGRRKSGRGRA